MNLVPSGGVCVVCHTQASYYSMDWYIHVCSTECLDTFISRYNKDIDNISIKRLEPDKL